MKSEYLSGSTFLSRVFKNFNVSRSLLFRFLITNWSFTLAHIRGCRLRGWWHRPHHLRWTPCWGAHAISAAITALKRSSIWGCAGPWGTGAWACWWTVWPTSSRTWARLSATAKHWSKIAPKVFTCRDKEKLVIFWGHFRGCWGCKTQFYQFWLFWKILVSNQNLKSCSAEDLLI